MKSIKLVTVVAITSLILMAECKKDNGNDKANVQIKMMDAPADFDALYVNVTSVEIKTDDGKW